MKTRDGRKLHDINGLTVALGPQTMDQWADYATRAMEPGNGGDNFSEPSMMTYAEFWTINKEDYAIIGTGHADFKTATILEARSGNIYIELGETVFQTIEAARINLVLV